MDHSKIMSPQEWEILDPSGPYVIVSYFFHYTRSSNVTRQIVTNFFLDQRPYNLFYIFPITDM